MMRTTVTFEGNGEADRAVLAEIVGPSPRWATARITNTSRTPTTDETPHDIGAHHV